MSRTPFDLDMNDLAAAGARASATANAEARAAGVIPATARSLSMNIRLTTGGANRARVEIGDVTLFFSFETCIAFNAGGFSLRDPEYVGFSKTTEIHATAMGCRSFRAARDQKDFHNSLADALGDLPHA